MRHISWAVSAICWLALLTGAQAQANPPGPQETPAATDDDRPPPLDEKEKPGRAAEKTLTVTGVVTSLHKSRKGDVDGLSLDGKTEVRFPASRQKADRCGFS